MFLLSIDLHDNLEDCRIKTLVLTLEKIFDYTASHTLPMRQFPPTEKCLILDDLNINTASTLVM